MATSETANERNGLEIAIIGMAGRFPGSRNVDELWDKLRDGTELISHFSDQELLSSGIAPGELNDPNYVKAHGALEGVEYFDAAFFGYNPREAEIMDPQHRLFLECAYEALECAGYNSETYEKLIGVYAGAGLNYYLLSNLYSNPDLLASVGGLQILIGGDKDFLPTRVSYKLDLRGPSININTSCSTSLVAVHMASRGLLMGECDMALAGGISIFVPQKAGYFYREGGINSPDGHCRAFDARAQGTVPASGVGIVVLKRLTDALKDGDYIYAVIKGSAINNDGALKAGYTAPSVKGQAQVIQAAHLMAEVDPETITYVETHGTGTPLGDPIEIAALTQAFGARTGKKGFCAIGSVKTNVGHLGAAAGVTGLIKTVQALRHRLLPPSLYFEQPNPQIDFSSSPFYVNTALIDWKVNGAPRRAGVSSFGIGGTNAHLVLEEAPAVEASGTARPWQLLRLSAKTLSALETSTQQLVTYLKQHPELPLADVAFTLQTGRRALCYRRVAICQTLDDAIATLETREPQRVLTANHESSELPVVFLFPGGGAQYIQMGRQLYEHEPVFREQIDRCATMLIPRLGIDLRSLLYPEQEEVEAASAQMRRISLALPALFVTEYALACLWMSWGVEPQAMIGHSLGEYVAACLAGVFSLSDALALVALRGELFERLPQGAMLSVPLAAQEVSSLLTPDLSLAASNGPALSVVSGSVEAIAQLEGSLNEQGLDVRRVQIDVAAHSLLVEPILETFRQFVETIPLHPPRIPYISNVTGTWITPQEACDPNYWARHLRQTVRFAEGVGVLLQNPDRLFLEVGPGHTLSTLTRQQLTPSHRHTAFASFGYTPAPRSELECVYTTLGQLWLSGAHIEWSAMYAHERRQRLPLPTYPFERQQYWVEPRERAGMDDNSHSTSNDKIASDGLQMEASFSLHHRPSLPNAYVAPSNEIERTVAAIWQELLGIEQIGIYDNFFALGGHSLLGTRLMSRIQDAFQLSLPLKTLFEATTVAELALVIVQSLAEQIDSDMLAELEQLSQDEVQARLAFEQEIHERKGFK
jgi:phthiocerol/phenolphthiocerol synthesis type-I polyketide synthase E